MFVFPEHVPKIGLRYPCGMTMSGFCNNVHMHSIAFFIAFWERFIYKNRDIRAARVRDTDVRGIMCNGGLRTAA